MHKKLAIRPVLNKYTKKELAEEWETELSDDIQLLWVWEEYEDYNGEALILFWDMREGKLKQVNGSHCSCYGFEGQWEPDDADIAELRMRTFSSFDDGEQVKAQFNRFLDRLEKVLPVAA